MIYLHNKNLQDGIKLKSSKLHLEFKNIDFGPNTPMDTYLMQGFVEVEIGVTPDQTQFIANNTQAKKGNNML